MKCKGCGRQFAIPADAATEVAAEFCRRCIDASYGLERRVAEANASSHVADAPREERERPGRKHRLARLAASLSADQRQLLLKLANGEAALLSVRGGSYAVWREGASVRVRSLDGGAETHTVVDSQCSCEDARFRGRRCKHVEAVENLM